MKWNFKLNGLHLFIILIGALVLFSFISPIMEGLENRGADMLGKPAGEQAMAAATFGQPQMPSFLQPISEKSITEPVGASADDDNNTSSYIGAAGDTVLVDNPRHPSQTTPPTAASTIPSHRLGLPKSEIPHGQEDLYILKSQIVPPVCPACPTVSSCPRSAPYPPCPPCSRCPEPSFECKKVPNYNNPTENSYLPRPVLSDFSQFGM